jgi:hypothetical protein
MSLIDNERAKLSATFSNNIAVAVIGSGLIAPFFVVLYGLENFSGERGSDSWGLPRQVGFSSASACISWRGACSES